MRKYTRLDFASEKKTNGSLIFLPFVRFTSKLYENGWWGKWTAVTASSNRSSISNNSIVSEKEASHICVITVLHRWNVFNNAVYLFFLYLPSFVTFFFFVFFVLIWFDCLALSSFRWRFFFVFSLHLCGCVREKKCPFECSFVENVCSHVAQVWVFWTLGFLSTVVEIVKVGFEFYKNVFPSFRVFFSSLSFGERGVYCGNDIVIATKQNTAKTNGR